MKAPLFQCRPCFLAALSQRRIQLPACLKRIIKWYVPPCFAQADIRKLLILERKWGHFQGGQERHILQGVVQHRQKGRHGADFRQSEIAFRPVKVHRHTLLLQELCQGWPHPRHLRQQNDHIPVFIEPARPVFLQGLGEQKFHPVHNSLAFRFQSCDGIFTVVGGIQQMNFHLWVVFRHPSRDQFILRQIVQLRDIFPHDLPEYAVCRIQHSISGSEVFLQKNTSFPCMFIIGKSSHTLQKQGRIRQSKSVDALLYIAHHE